jgi:hypothetical protein
VTGGHPVPLATRRVGVKLPQPNCLGARPTFDPLYPPGVWAPDSVRTIKHDLDQIPVGTCSYHAGCTQFAVLGLLLWALLQRAWLGAWLAVT